MKIKNFALWFIIQWMLTTLWSAHASCWFYHNLWFITFISESWWITSMKIMLSVIYQLKARLLNRSLNLFLALSSHFRYFFTRHPRLLKCQILGNLEFHNRRLCYEKAPWKESNRKGLSSNYHIVNKNLTTSQILIQNAIHN